VELITFAMVFNSTFTMILKPKRINLFIMKKVIINSLILIFSSTLLLACGEKDTNDSNVEVTDSTTNVVGGNNCFEDFVGQPEKLLTAELVGEFVDFEGQTPSVEKVEMPFKTVADENATVNCKWKVDRKRRIVRLQQIKKIKLYKSKTAVERFYDKYHTSSSTESAEKKELYDNEVIDKAEDENAKEIGTKIVDLDFEYLKVDNVGDAAVWEHKVNNLLVLVGDYQFTVNVQLTKGNDFDLEKAILIAKAIIVKACN